MYAFCIKNWENTSKQFLNIMYYMTLKLLKIQKYSQENKIKIYIKKQSG